jgi:hypothetical protein
MNQAILQWALGGGLGILITLVANALINRRKLSADTAKTLNQAAQIANQAVDARMQNLRDELYDAMGLSDARRITMGKMEVAIGIMRLRMERHATWDYKMKDAVDVLQMELRQQGIPVDVSIADPPPLDFSDIDFDFSVKPVPLRSGTRPNTPQDR